MDVSFLGPNSAQGDLYPLLMERTQIPNEHEHEHEHIIDITRTNNSSSSSSHYEHHPGVDLPQHDENATRSTRTSPHLRPSSSSSNRQNSTNPTFTRRGDGYVRRRRSPLNSGLWISVELAVTLGQIIASVVVLSLSRNENPQAPLFAWVVGYASGCVATLPVLYWRFRNRNQRTEQESLQQHGGSSQSNVPESTSYTDVSVSHTRDEENHHAPITRRNSQARGSLITRLNGLVDHFKMALDCFFAVWFVVGNVWIFGGHSSPSDAPKLYRLCIVFLTFSCIGYAMPFILCATICCCLPCIISVLGFREDFSQSRGASTECISALPIYKFRSKKIGNINDPDSMRECEGGILAAGTEKERMISGEDAVCCICLAKYEDNDEVRELPCSHVFHVECVDKWLKINASCPLCKHEVGESGNVTSVARDSSQN